MKTRTKKNDPPDLPTADPHSIPTQVQNINPPSSAELPPFDVGSSSGGGGPGRRSTPSLVRQSTTLGRVLVVPNERGIGNRSRSVPHFPACLRGSEQGGTRDCAPELSNHQVLQAHLEHKILRGQVDLEPELAPDPLDPPVAETGSGGARTRNETSSSDPPRMTGFGAGVPGQQLPQIRPSPSEESLDEQVFAFRPR